MSQYTAQQRISALNVADKVQKSLIVGIGQQGVGFLLQGRTLGVFRADI